jgi:hypothetical protein
MQFFGEGFREAKPLVGLPESQDAKAGGKLPAFQFDVDSWIESGLNDFGRRFKKTRIWQNGSAGHGFSSWFMSFWRKWLNYNAL